MLRPSMYQIIGKNESYYSLVIGIAKRAREIADQHVKEKEEAKAAAERRAKQNGEQKIRLDDKMMKWSCWRRIRSKRLSMNLQRANTVWRNRTRKLRTDVYRQCRRARVCCAGRAGCGCIRL